MTRRRYVQVNGELIEVSPDAEITPRADANAHGVLWNDRSYQDAGDQRFRSRSQHREYMKRYGLATVDDFQGEWRKKEAERIKVLQGYDPTRKEDLNRVISQLNSRRK